MHSGMPLGVGVGIGVFGDAPGGDLVYIRFILRVEVRSEDSLRGGGLRARRSGLRAQG